MIFEFFQNTNFFLNLYSDFLLINSSLLLLTLFIFIDYKTKYKNKFYQSLIVLISFIIFFLLLLILNDFNYLSYSFQFLFIYDYYSKSLKILTICFFIFIYLLSNFYFKIENFFSFEFYVLLLLSLIGFFLVITSYDLLSLYLGVELQSLCFYILASLKKFSTFSTEAGLKYFILGAFSSGIFLFGCSFIYGFTGLTNFYELEIFFQNQGVPTDILNGVFLGSFFLIVGLLFKLGAAPFHMWSIDVYEGSPTIIMAFFSILPKLTLIGFVLRFFNQFFNQNFYYLGEFLLICAFLSLIIGALGALYQVKIKRLLAYSSITNMGFILIALSVNSLESFFSIFFYLLIYMILSLTLFSIILTIRKWTNLKKIKKINEFIFLNKNNKTLALIFIFTLFSFAGIPPLVGFYSKFYIFFVGIQTNFFLIIVLAALISVLSALYYIRLIKISYFKKSNYFLFIKNIDFLPSLIISISFLFNFFFFFYPNVIIMFLHNMILFYFL